MKLPNPIYMEDHFNPGFKVDNAIHVGSQNIHFYRNTRDQSWDGIQLVAAKPGDVVIVRNLDTDYIEYWKSIVGDIEVVNLTIDDENSGKFITENILESDEVLANVKKYVTPKHTSLVCFMPTEYEEKLARQLNIPLHGIAEIAQKYGTKSGTRKLAEDSKLKITPGYIATTVEQALSAVTKLQQDYEEIVIKHDLSISGDLSKKFASSDSKTIRDYLPSVLSSTEDNAIVVEGWVKGKVSLCAHIEILQDKDPIICAGWQQIIDTDGVSFLGAGPLSISEKARKNFYDEVTKLANILKNKGAIGSFGPDYLVVDNKDKNFKEDDVVLVELNARVPYTAYPLEILKHVRGNIGQGFISQHVYLQTPRTFKEIKDILQKENLLITEKHPNAVGVIPYNVGVLPWKIFDLVAMADTFDEAIDIAERAKKLLQ